MGLPKLGMVIQPGIEFTGTVTVASLDFPEDLLSDPQISLNLLTETMIRDLLPPRPRDGHKGTFGSVMIVGGSQGMTGAPVLASRAAMRSGV
jgi:NAD(P)H-hydrate epimerase